MERAGEVSHTLDRIQELVTELEELSQVSHVNKYIRVSLRGGREGTCLNGLFESLDIVLACVGLAFLLTALH